MTPTRILLLATVLCALCVSVIATTGLESQLSAIELPEPEMRDVEYVDSIAQSIGLVEVSAAQDEAAEAADQLQAQADAAEEAADQQSAEADEEALIEVDPLSQLAAPTNAKELLPTRQVPAPRDTFRDAPVSSAIPESNAVTSPRIASAISHLNKLARDEKVAAYEDYKLKRHQYGYARAVEKSRQSTNFERPLPPTQAQIPHPSSNAATFNGERNHNTLFPAATAKSDNKAPSQNYDFQHRGNGDAFAEHTNLVESASHSTDDGEAEGQVEDAQAPAAEEAPADAPADAPVTAREPCAAECDVAGGWKTAGCQDCIVRGMVNGWIVRSIVDKQAGYNYAHYARNKCVAYANELHKRSSEVKGAPFAHCFFQKMHETCNL